MPTKSKPNPKGKKGLAAARATIAGAIIAAVAAIVAALISTYGHNSSGQPTPTVSSPAHATVTQPAAGVTPETVEYPVPEFADYFGQSDLERHLSPGDVVSVDCRVPGDSNTPSSVGKAGRYRIQNQNNTVGYAASNTFYNDPGNGRDMVPNNMAFDPAVPTC